MQEVMLSYGRDTVVGLSINGQIWLRVPHIRGYLGLTEKAIWRLFERSKKWFGSQETRIVSIPTAGGVQDVRVFSEIGVAMLAMLSQRPEAIPFRHWIMKRAIKRETPELPDGRPARAGYILSLDQTKLLDFLAQYAEPGSKIDTVIKGVRTGSLAPETDLALSHLATKYRDAGAKMAEAKRVHADVNREARELGYDPEAVKRAARMMSLRETHPQLALEDAP